MALKDDGSVVSWGWNYAGQATVPLLAKSGVMAIAAGFAHTLALLTNGSVAAWGENFNGQTTVPFAAKSGVMAIAAGEFHSVALKKDGSVVVWGGSGGPPLTVPVGLPPIFAIAAGYDFTVALVHDPAPFLTILRNADQTVNLSWRGAGVLEQIESLTAPNWQTASNQANPQTLSTAESIMLYRVKAD